MAQTVLNGDVFCTGGLSSKTFTAPSGSISDDAVASNAKIKATKLIHQLPLRYSTSTSSAAITATELLHIAKATGEIASIEVCATTAPTSSDQFTVDLQKGNSSTAFTSVLSSAVTVTSSHSDREVVAGTISSADYSADDIFQIVVTVSGSSTEGILVVVNLHEQAQ